MSMYDDAGEDVPLYLGDHGLTVFLDDDTVGVRTRDDDVAIYRDTEPITTNYGLMERQIGGMLPDGFDIEYDDHAFVIRSTEPVPVPDSERYFGLVQDTGSYRMTLTDRAGDAPVIPQRSARFTRQMEEESAIPSVPEDASALVMEGTDLFGVSGVFDATRTAADRMFDLDMEHDEF